MRLVCVFVLIHGSMFVGRTSIYKGSVNALTWSLSNVIHPSVWYYISLRDLVPQIIENELDGNLRMIVVIAHMGWILELGTYGVDIIEFWAHGRIPIRAIMGGIHTLILTILLNYRAMSWSRSCSRISSPMCILPIIYFADPYKPSNVISWEFR